MTAWPGLTPRVVQTLADGFLQAADVAATLADTTAPSPDTVKVIRAVAGRRLTLELILFFGRNGCPTDQVVDCCDVVLARVAKLLEHRHKLEGEAAGSA